MRGLRGESVGNNTILPFLLRQGNKPMFEPIQQNTRGGIARISLCIGYKQV